MKSFIDFLREKYLEEKLIQFSKGKRHGQVVFLAGGAGSGKGFVIKNFLEGDKFKIRDVDDWKKSFIKISKLKNKYDEIQGLDLSTPADVYKLHKFIRNKNIKDKSLDNLLSDVKSDRLPNIIFDITAKEVTDITDVIPKLIDAGYDPKNIHLTWVLTDFHIAFQANRNRSRIVPDDILLQTHEGATKTMYNILKGNVPRNLDGEIHVVVNDRELTTHWTDKNGNVIKNSKGQKIVKDFLSFKVKESGKRIESENEVMKQVFEWIKKNAPKSLSLKDLTK